MLLKSKRPLTFATEAGWLRYQAFGWRERERWHYGVIAGHPVRVRPSTRGLKVRSDARDPAPAKAVRRYFRLDQDVQKVHAALSRDPKMAALVKRYGAMRVLRQDPWECLALYICGRLGVDGIPQVRTELCEKHGDEPLQLNGVMLSSFPTASQLYKRGGPDGSPLQVAGMTKDQARSIWEAAGVVTAGELEFNRLRKLPLDEARERLMALRGVREKTADCVCLFALGKDKAFPLDTHIANAVAKQYERKFNPKRVGDHKAATEWARERFGKHAGYASQLLFLSDILEG